MTSDKLRQRKHVRPRPWTVIDADLDRGYPRISADGEAGDEDRRFLQSHSIGKVFGPRDDPYHPIVDEVETTYTGAADVLAHKRTYSWQHPLCDIVNGLIQAGMTLNWLHEHAALTWPLFPNMAMSEDGLYRLPADHVQLPLAFSLEARKV